MASPFENTERSSTPFPDSDPTKVETDSPERAPSPSSAVPDRAEPGARVLGFPHHRSDTAVFVRRQHILAHGRQPNGFADSGGRSSAVRLRSAFYGDTRRGRYCQACLALKGDEWGESHRERVRQRRKVGDTKGPRSLLSSGAVVR